MNLEVIAQLINLALIVTSSPLVIASLLNLLKIKGQSISLTYVRLLGCTSPTFLKQS